jgi:hypothetical protein
LYPPTRKRRWFLQRPDEEFLINQTVAAVAIFPPLHQPHLDKDEGMLFFARRASSLHP